MCILSLFSMNGVCFSTLMDTDLPFLFVSFMWNSVITFCCILTFMMNMYLDYYIYEGSRGIWLLVIALLHCSRYRFCVIFVICLLNLHVVVSNINFYLKFMIVISGKSRFVVVPVLLQTFAYCYQLMIFPENSLIINIGSIPLF